MTKEQIEQQLLEQGIRCHRLKPVGYPLNNVQIYHSEAHYTSPDSPSRNLQLRIIVESDKVHVTLYEQVRTIMLETQ